MPTAEHKMHISWEALGRQAKLKLFIVKNDSETGSCFGLLDQYEPHLYESIMHIPIVNTAFDNRYLLRRDESAPQVNAVMVCR